VRPGKIETCGAVRRKSRALASIVPHSGVGGWAPRPRNPGRRPTGSPSRTAAWTARAAAADSWAVDVARHDAPLAGARGPGPPPRSAAP
jgi:hypothetical protein